MRASDPAGYEGIEEIASGGTATGRGLLVTNSTTSPIAMTVSVLTNELQSITRDYEAGTTETVRKTVSLVLQVGTGTTVIPIVGTFTISSVPSNVKAYALR